MTHEPIADLGLILYLSFMFLDWNTPVNDHFEVFNVIVRSSRSLTCAIFENYPKKNRRRVKRQKQPSPKERQVKKTKDNHSPKEQQVKKNFCLNNHHSDADSAVAKTKPDNALKF